MTNSEMADRAEFLQSALDKAVADLAEAHRQVRILTKQKQLAVDALHHIEAHGSQAEERHTACKALNAIWEITDA